MNKLNRFSLYCKIGTFIPFFIIITMALIKNVKFKKAVNNSASIKIVDYKEKYASNPSDVKRKYLDHLFNTKSE